MHRIAFVFSGQGDQYPGMGKDLYEQHPIAASLFQTFEAIRPGTTAQCFTGTEAELQETQNTQPCLFAMELAAAAVLYEQGIFPNALAGFSLGEVAAATVAGIFDEPTGFRLVCRRGALMQQEAERFDTGMAAVVKLPPETVRAICSHYSAVYPVNFNCPGQITVSGLSSQMADFSAEVKAAGGRALPLPVKGAFHSPFMKQAADAFSKELAGIRLHKNSLPLYSNVTADLYTDHAADLLSRQICSPVLWEATIRRMIDDGIRTFIEIGPGKTLSRMIQKTDASVATYSISELPALLAARKERSE